MTTRTLQHCIICGMFVANLLILQPESVAQDTTTTRAEFDQTIHQWKEACKELRELGFSYGISTQDEAAVLDEQRQKLFKKGDDLYLKAIDQAADLYRSESSSTELQEFLVSVRGKMLDAGFFEKTLKIGMALLEGAKRQNQTPDVRDLASLVQIATFCNEYEIAADLVKQIKEVNGSLSQNLKTFLNDSPRLIADWKAEQDLRAAEDLAANLPRVQIKTTKGEFTIELFENQVPNSVAHFLELVSQNTYDGNNFYEVVQQGLAITGSPLNDGQMATDKIVKSMSGAEDARHHFRGSVLLLSSSDRKYSGSIFGICRVASPSLDGIHTVIGRVVSGMSTVDQLTNSYTITPDGIREKAEEFTPDKIISAEIVRASTASLEVERVELDGNNAGRVENDDQTNSKSSNPAESSNDKR